MRTTLALSVATALVSCTLAAGPALAAGEDTRPPVARTLTAGGGSARVDTSAGPATEHVVIEISDDSALAGLPRTVTACHKVHTTNCLAPAALTDDHPEWTSPRQLSADLTFPALSEPGAWLLVLPEVSDVHGNTRPASPLNDYSSDGLGVLGDPAVTDLTSPQVTVLPTSPRQLYTRDGLDRVRVAVRVVEPDRGSGAHAVEVALTDPHNPTVRAALSLESGTAADGVWAAHVRIPHDYTPSSMQAGFVAENSQGLVSVAMAENFTFSHTWHRPFAVTAPTFTQGCGPDGQVTITDTHPDVTWEVTGRSGTRIVGAGRPAVLAASGDILVSATTPYDPLTLTGTTSWALDLGSFASCATGITGGRSGRIYGVDAAGNLQFFSGTVDGMALRGQKGSGWSGMSHLAQVESLAGDANRDLLARRRSDNSLWLYRTATDGAVAAVRKVGSNWGGMDQIVPVFNLDGGAAQYVVARRASDGALFRYTLTPTGLSGTTRIGSGWGGMRQIVGVGDFDGDRRADVLGLRRDGMLYLYPGTRQGTIGAGRQVGHGWGNFDHVFSPGDLTADGRPDLVGRRGDGSLFSYENRTGSWGPARQVMAGTQGYRLLA